MKIHIQQAISQQYIGDEGAWVPTISQARDFHTSIRALHFCFAHRLSAVHIRARFASSAGDIVWRVSEAAPEIPSQQISA